MTTPTPAASPTASATRRNGRTRGWPAPPSVASATYVAMLCVAWPDGKELGAHMHQVDVGRRAGAVHEVLGQAVETDRPAPCDSEYERRPHLPPREEQDDEDPRHRCEHLLAPDRGQHPRHRGDGGARWATIHDVMELSMAVEPSGRSTCASSSPAATAHPSRCRTTPPSPREGVAATASVSPARARRRPYPNDIVPARRRPQVVFSRPPSITQLGR